MGLKNFESGRGKSAGFQRIAESVSEDFNSCADDAFSHRVNTWSLDGGSSDNVIDFGPRYKGTGSGGPPGSRLVPHSCTRPNMGESTGASRRGATAHRMHELRHISLNNRSHVSIGDTQKFSLTRSVKRQPIARNWSPARKRYVATIACLSTAVVGTLVGIYAGLVPSIQYYIADFHHYATIGNVALYSGMALPTFFCWPLPLLHGRKPYIVCSLSVALPLLFPQAVAVSSFRSPNTHLWRTVLLLPRGLMGFVLGFASMNFHSILTDLFGASLMSSKPHQEVVDLYDVRRHGGGLGIWLGVWTWCWIGSLSVGFLMGALVIQHLPPSHGLYISIALVGIALAINVICPEVRRAAWRRSATEIRNGTTVSRRLARGEVMMHRVKNGPRWWGQEMYHGIALSLEMLRQPGFVIMAVYTAWIYAQVVLIIVVSLPNGLALFTDPSLTALARTAPGVTNFEILPLSVSSRWCGGLISGHWCPCSCTIPNGEYLLKSQIQAPTDEQHDLRGDVVDLSPSPSLNIHARPPDGGRIICGSFRGPTHPCQCSLLHRRCDRLSVVPRHLRVQWLVDGDIGYLRSSTRHDRPS